MTSPESSTQSVSETCIHELWACALSHEAGVRLVGNVRADAIVALCRDYVCLRTENETLRARVAELDLCQCKRSNGTIGIKCLDCGKPTQRINVSAHPVEGGRAIARAESIVCPSCGDQYEGQEVEYDGDERDYDCVGCGAQFFVTVRVSRSYLISRVSDPAPPAAKVTP